MKPYYKNQCGELYHCDCLDLIDELPDNNVDLVVTSPPYDDMRGIQSLSFEDFKLVAIGLKRILKDGGVIIWITGDQTIDRCETLTSSRQAIFFQEIGMKIDTMIFQKLTYLPDNRDDRYDNTFDYMFRISKSKVKTFNPIMVPTVTAGEKRYPKKGANLSESNKDKKSHRSRMETNYIITKDEKMRGNIWPYNTGMHGSNESFQTDHPASFPEKLVEDHMISWSNLGDLIFDPFAGSGTVGKIAQLMERRWIMCEIEEKYCKLIKNRMKGIFQWEAK